jgi:hypothetical protein
VCPRVNKTVGTPVRVGPHEQRQFRGVERGSTSDTVIDANTGNGLLVGVQVYTATGVLSEAAGTNRLVDAQSRACGRAALRAQVDPSRRVLSGRPVKDLSRSSGCSVTTGTPITVLSGVVSRGVDFALLRRGRRLRRQGRYCGLAALAWYLMKRGRSAVPDHRQSTDPARPAGEGGHDEGRGWERQCGSEHSPRRGRLSKLYSAEADFWPV